MGGGPGLDWQACPMMSTHHPCSLPDFIHGGIYNCMRKTNNHTQVSSSMCWISTCASG